MEYLKNVFLRNFVILASKTSKERFLLLNLHLNFNKYLQLSIFNLYGRQIFSQSA
jgi:hypothetical protein